MFIRVNTTPNSPRKSIQIVESIRHGDKVKQKIIRYVGVATNDYEQQKLEDLARDYIAQITKERLEESKQLSLLETATEDEVKVALQKKYGRKNKKQLKDILPVEEVKLVDIDEKERLVEGVHEVGNVVYNMLGYDAILQKRDDKILRDLVLARLWVLPHIRAKLAMKSFYMNKFTTLGIEFYQDQRCFRSNCHL